MLNWTYMYVSHTAHAGSPLPPDPEDAATEEPDSDSPHRQFLCTRWELSPQLQLLAAVSGQFNPHIDWLLERLGFKHARTTIPKWIQRGAMDPMDMAVSNIIELLVKLSATKKVRNINAIHSPIIASKVPQTIQE